jgi:hypothetical protein
MDGVGQSISFGSNASMTRCLDINCHGVYFTAEVMSIARTEGDPHEIR